MNISEIEDLIRRIPKTDLHCHLDGSIRLTTLLDIAKKEGLPLPADTDAGLNESVFKDRYENLEDYLRTFGLSCSVMQRPEYLERIACELAEDAQADGVRYLEVRFAPQLHITEDMDMKTILVSVNKGLRRAKHDFNMREEVLNGSEPKFHYGIIVCALRSFGAISDYYARFINA
ncbi:MAG TPA: adenosine deaminase family protein, partial [bacterium]|nr:adenosine deaminase family protein [bacterium]